MRPSFREVCILVLAINLLSACGDRREPDTAHDIVNGDPVYGGTLKMVGYGDVDHLASTSAYVSSASFLIRTFARQLVAYQAADDYHDSATLKPDIALEIPTMENGGLSADGRTYVFHLKPGVRWNSSPPRAVVAGDFVRALKLFCNPVNPVGAPGYYTSTIKGICAAVLTEKSGFCFSHIVQLLMAS